MKNNISKLLITSILMIGTVTACGRDVPSISEPNSQITSVSENGSIVESATSVTSENASTISSITSEQVPGEKLSVTYDANGGSGTAPTDTNKYDSGSKVTVKENTFTAPAGKEFINWNEEPDGSGSYHNANSTFKIYENITLYAQWLDAEVPPIIITEDEKEHNISVSAPAGVTYTLSSSKAIKDTVITLTVSTSGVELDGDPVSSDVSLSKTGAGTYTFVMPAKNVSINISIVMSGDVMLTGDINAILTDDDQDGIYTAEVACNDKTSYSFSYVVKDGGKTTSLSSMKLDETRCNANVTFASGNNALMIAGGCTYVFCYDSNATDYNCYVLRKSVDVLPMNSKTLYNLFDGRMRSQSTIHPQNLTSIHYEKKVDGANAETSYKLTDEVYDYKKISDTESFAVSKDNLTNKNSFVYKNIDTTNNVYSIINTYSKSKGDSGKVLGNNEADDNVWNIDPYSDGEDYYMPYSAKQDIVADSLYRETSRYQITKREAYRNVNMAAHYGAALEYEIWTAIRGDFDGTASINAANAEGSHISIVSTPNQNGFTTVVDSQLEYNHIESGSTADVTQQYAFVYNYTMNFSSNGDLICLDYVEKFYSLDVWNFTTHSPKDGATPITMTIKVTNGFNEDFSSTRTDVLNGFSPEDYFISSIDSLSFYDSSTGIDKSSTESIMNFDASLNIFDYKGGSKPSKLVDKFEFTPSTALDGWQYGFVSSTDKSVADNTVYGPKTIGIGTATVTFGNHLENIAGPTKDVKVSVYAKGTFHSLFVNCTKQGYDSFDCDHADYINGYAGKTMNYYIDSGTNTGCPVSYYMVIKEKNSFGDITYKSTSSYFNIVNGCGEAYNEELGKTFTKVIGNELILDFNTEASNALTSSKQIDVVFMSDYYADGFGPSTLHIVINPAVNSLSGSSFMCTYMYDATLNPSLADKKFEDATIDFMLGGKGKITEVLYDESGAVKFTNVYKFTYSELNNSRVSAYITSVEIGETGMPTTASSYGIAIERQLDGSIGVALYTEDMDIFGEAVEDEEGYLTVENLTKFELVTD